MTTKREERMVRVRALKDYELKLLPVPVERAYWVTCRVCPPTSMAPGDFFSALLGMAFADAHAQLHADKACPTCRHIPETAVSLTDTHALMQVRAS